VEAEELAACFAELAGTIEKHLETTRRLLAQCEYLTESNATMQTELELLGDRIGVVHAQTIVRDNAITEQMDALDGRLTTVHKAALRALNLTHGGAPAA
jgi:chorismate-pyruvate lyase